ncbi:DUF1015 domain-containing protein [Leptospirillum ferriphilum]|jgi:uncharacterized protein (DUF1015 family)|uniref:DUF1015 domain-containing protein n=2 Tax=Leptospirillum TaxID=179 RepID=A0A094WB56_9BACT|nr:DUF1015 domain-containing protein [Leptospirillum ferriphilum]EDZ39939.1 MAG: Protein of unknown function [Leptospirillum sp. Group II '5-way CG']KGA94773.1 conserved hypothetical protein-putative phosphatase [Leptospirillum ferriphilum]
MSEIVPFRGLVYKNGLKENMDRLTAPPYDIISKEAQKEFYAMDPNNVIRLELPIPPDKETPGNNRYTEARKELDRMRREGILVVDPQPAIYPYSMTYKDPYTRKERTIRGLVARIRLEEWEKKVVYPHEKTLAGPKEDRMSLFKETQAAFSQIFCLYPDPAASVVKKLYASASPRFQAKDQDGVVHALMSVTDPAVLAEVQQYFSKVPLFIADGHHRYETYLAYRNFRRSQEPDAGPNAPFEFITVFLAALEDENLTVLPTHRMIHNVPPELISGLFRQEGVLKTEEIFSYENKEQFLKILMSSDTNRILFGLIRKDPRELRIVSLNKEKGAGVRSLDSWWLQESVLGPVLGIVPERVAKEDLLRYSKSAEDVIQKVGTGEYPVAFLLRPSSPRVVEEVSLRGELMPQKSTYFYPKPLTGMVMTLL